MGKRNSNRTNFDNTAETNELSPIYKESLNELILEITKELRDEQYIDKLNGYNKPDAPKLNLTNNKVLLPSHRGRLYKKMKEKMESDNESKTTGAIAEFFNENRSQPRRYIRCTNLPPKLTNMFDSKLLTYEAADKLLGLESKVLKFIDKLLLDNNIDLKISKKQAIELKELGKELEKRREEPNSEQVYEILGIEKLPVSNGKH